MDVPVEKVRVVTNKDPAWQLLLMQDYLRFFLFSHQKKKLFCREMFLLIFICVY